MSRADVRALAAIHELRGPLGVISLALELWRRGAAPTRAQLDGLALELECAARALQALEALHSRPHVKRAPSASERPARSRPTGGPSAREWVALDELITCAVDAMQGLAAHHGATLRGAWSGPCARVWGDRVALSRAIGNLIANALEHGEGGVVVEGRIRGAVACVSVSDRGPGLPAPLARLIRPAAPPPRAPGASPQGRPPQQGPSARGWGLGIAAELAARHGGRLGAAPSTQGARLVLELPAVRAGSSASCRGAG